MLSLPGTRQRRLRQVDCRLERPRHLPPCSPQARTGTSTLPFGGGSEPVGPEDVFGPARPDRPDEFVDGESLDWIQVILLAGFVIVILIVRPRQ